MSSKTKIVVLKARELIYTGIFILLGILLILLLIFMFVPSHKSKKTKETSGYTQGVYSSPLKLGENELELSVTVKDGKARSVSLKHLNKSIKTMYPLIEPSLNEINKQLPKVQNIDDIKFDEYEESRVFAGIYETILRELQSAGSAGEFYTPRAVTDFMAQMIDPQIGEKMADFACGTGGFLTSWLKVLRQKIQTTTDENLCNNSIYGVEKKQFPYILCITNMLLHDVDVPQVFHDNTLLRDVLDYTEDDQVDVILMNPPYGGSEKPEIKNHFPADLASSETADLFMSVIMYRLKENGRAAVILPDGFLFGTDNAKVAIKTKLFSEFNVHTIIRMPGSVFSPYTSITTNILFFDHTGPTEETWFYRLDMPKGYKHFSKTKPMKLEHFAPAVEWWRDRKEIQLDGFDKAKKYTVQEIKDRNYNIDLCGYPHEEEEILPPKELIQQYQEKRASLNADIDRILAQITEILGIDLDAQD